jgi:hypothetical protein
MSAPRQVDLSAAQRQELVAIRDRHAKAYYRERAGAVLKIADGMPLSVVARQGLLKPRHPETVRRWVVSYEREGVAGWQIRPGRGRRPAFSPSAAASSRG